MLFRLSYIFFFIFAISESLISYDFDIKGEAQNGYYISATIGTPPQHVNLLIDTGSSNLAVATVSQRKGNTHFFVFNESQTFRPSDTSVQLRYVQGDWNGFLALDVFNLCLENDCAVTCNISCMTSMKDIFDENSQFQGILGLAYSSIANPSPLARPFFDIFTEMKNTSNVFSLFLCGPFISSKYHTSQCGKFHIGYSLEYADDHIMYTPLVHESFYEVTVIDLKVGSNSSPVTCTELNKDRTVIDSGTTKLNVPPSVYHWIISEIHNYVRLKELWINETVVCMQSETFNSSIFPHLTLTLYHSKNSSFNLHISPELYLLPVKSSSDTCVKLGIGVSNSGIVIGSTIMKGFYVIFDRENKRVGFANPLDIQHDNFIGEVSNVLVYDNDFEYCIRSDMPADNTISPLLIIALVLLCIVTVLFLYAFLSWIWKFHIAPGDNLSDTSSLVDD